jgi:hypothetical protein
LGRISTSKAVLLGAWASSNHAVALQRLVILDVLLELAEWVAGRGALGSSSHERHGEVGSDSKQET